MTSGWVFDSPRAQSLTKARQIWFREVIGRLKQDLNLKTALDVGCGVGYFSSFLDEMGFDVTAFDGRQDNVEEAKKRVPGVEFQTANIEESNVQKLGVFDLVLCPGVLYHLENPLNAVRNLYALAHKVLIIESMCIPHGQPLAYLREEEHAEDESLNFVAFYPSESLITKMCYAAGFPHVYRPTSLPIHPDFQKKIWRNKLRTVFIASKIPLNGSNLRPVRQAHDAASPWLNPLGWTLRLLRSIARKLLRKSSA